MPGAPNDSPKPASRSRPAALVVGMFVVLVVIGSPLSTLDHALLTFHMVQHLLLMTIAAPLILLGRPGAALSRAVPRRVRSAPARLLRSPAVRRIGRSITHGAFWWLAGAGV